MGSLGYRLFTIVLAIAVSVLLRPHEVLAANGPTSMSCGQWDGVVLHNPPRPALVTRAPGVLDDEWGELEECGPAEPPERIDLGRVSASPTIRGALASFAVRARERWRPRPRGPPRDPRRRHRDPDPTPVSAVIG